MVNLRTRIISLVLVSISAAATAENYRKPLGEIDFFGYKGLDLTAIPSALPFHEGDMFPPTTAKSSEHLKRKVSEAVKQVIGRYPTSVSFVCCDSKQNWTVYIGLPGESYQEPTFNSVPAGKVRLPKAALTLRHQFDKAWMAAINSGHASEDDSEGYTLTNDPKARAAELAIRDYALHNEVLIMEVLRSSSEGEHRAIAAQMLGYGRQSDEQIDILVAASLDADDKVRNDAVRALEVLAGAKPNLAQRIPSGPIVKLLRSGSWGDHNKASLLLLALTKSRDPKLLELLRTEAIDPLLEMAQWRSSGHAAAALSTLGRIAGIDEESLDKLIEVGQVDAIVSKVLQHK